jgi:hypothetical protein
MFLPDFWFFQWWAGLGTPARLGVAVSILVLGVICWFAFGFHPWLWRLSIVCWALGAGLLIFAFPSDSEKKGYHD